MRNASLIAGDAAALAVVTGIGFASHGEFSPAFILRMAASWIPLCIGWFLLAPPLGLFQESTTRTTTELWRPAFVMLFAGPLAALLRGIVLASPVQPTFAVVLSLTGALALTIWRTMWWMLGRSTARRQAPP